MNKILSVLMLCLTTTTFASTITYTASNPKAVPQCHKIDDNKLNMMSQLEIERQICIYDNYAKLNEKWSSSPPQNVVPANSIVININQPATSEQLKEAFTNASNQCKELATNMKNNLKTMYGIETYKCH